MATQGETRMLTSYRQIIEHLRTPVYRNGYFLMISSLSTSGIGLIYWIVAAHRYSTYLVGINSALIAAMTFLAGVAELNLMSALIRFIPMAGKNTKHFVLIAYLTSLVVSAAISIIFIMNIGRFAPALGFLRDNRALTIWFILATMSWSIFVLQDSVLTGLRQTSWVPIENTVYSITKIALMVIFAASIPALGIYASWTFALFVAILPTNYFIFSKLIPRHTQREEQAHTSIEAKLVVRFAATDYLGALFWLIATTLMPVIVTTVSGATANAYYYLAWTIANTLFLIPPAMGSSLVVETARNQQRLGYYSRRVLVNAIKIVVPAAILIAISADYILMIFGKGYSSQGANLLRLLALSAIPNVMNSIYVSVARVQRRLRQEVTALGVLCSLVLVSSFLFLKEFGIIGVGMGWLGSQLLVAIFLYVFQVRGIWKYQERTANVPGRTDSIGGLYPTVINILYKLSKALHVYPILTLAQRHWLAQRKYSKVAHLLPGMINDLSTEISSSKSERWDLMRIAKNQTNTFVAFFHSSNGSGPMVLKIPGNSREAESLRKQEENLITLGEYDDLGDWRKVLPVVIACGRFDGQEYYAEKMMPGVGLDKLIRDDQIGWNMISLAAREIDTLHTKTARNVVVDSPLIEKWVDEPIDHLIQYSFNNCVPYAYGDVIDTLRERLHAALINRKVDISWIHGDYSPANILVDPAKQQVTGIVDWDLSRPDELPLLDLLHLLISMRMETKKRTMGQVVSELLLSKDWHPDELELIQATGQNLQGSAIVLRDLLLLTWLRHLNANITKTAHFDHHRRWGAENFEAVLKVLRDGLK